MSTKYVFIEPAKRYVMLKFIGLFCLIFLLNVRSGVEIFRVPQLSKRKGSLLLTAFNPIHDMRLDVYAEAILVFCVPLFK